MLAQIKPERVSYHSVCFLDGKLHAFISLYTYPMESQSPVFSTQLSTQCLCEWEMTAADCIITHLSVALLFSDSNCQALWKTKMTFPCAWCTRCPALHDISCVVYQCLYWVSPTSSLSCMYSPITRWFPVSVYSYPPSSKWVTVTRILRVTTMIYR